MLQIGHTWANPGKGNTSQDMMIIEHNAAIGTKHVTQTHNSAWTRENHYYGLFRETGHTKGVGARPSGGYNAVMAKS